MKNSTARAMQIVCLMGEQIEQLHELEKNRGYLIPNWNIQSLFGLPTIKDRFRIPFDDAAQSNHAMRIESEINKNGFYNVELSHIENNMNLDWTHAFDWTIFNNQGKISWDYVGGRTGGVLNRIKREGNEDEP